MTAAWDHYVPHIDVNFSRFSSAISFASSIFLGYKVVHWLLVGVQEQALLTVYLLGPRFCAPPTPTPGGGHVNSSPALTTGAFLCSWGVQLGSWEKDKTAKSQVVCPRSEDFPPHWASPCATLTLISDLPMVLGAISMFPWGPRGPRP